MKQPLRTMSIALVATVFSTAAFAQEIPLNIFVTGTTGTETSQGTSVGVLTTTATTTTSVTSVTAALTVSTEASISTD